MGEVRLVIDYTEKETKLEASEGTLEEYLEATGNAMRALASKAEIEPLALFKDALKNEAIRSELRPSEVFAMEALRLASLGE